MEIAHSNLPKTESYLLHQQIAGHGHLMAEEPFGLCLLQHSLSGACHELL